MCFGHFEIGMSNLGAPIISRISKTTWNVKIGHMLFFVHLVELNN